MSKKPVLAFVHQNIPAQFRNLAPAMAAAGNDVYFITAGQGESAGTKRVQYQIDVKNELPAVAQFTYAQKVTKALLHLQTELKVVPDLIIGHVGWGELLYVKDLYPKVPVLGYFEWYLRAKPLADFAPTEPVDRDAPFVFRMKNTANVMSAELCDAGLTPMHYQYASYPASIQKKLNVIHDGIDTVSIRRPARGKLTLPDGRVLTSADEVVTYVGRGLEPLRGFPTAIRAIAELCKTRPKAHFVIIGADEPAYGNPLPNGETHRQRLLAELEIDATRVHFLGRVPYTTFLDVLYVSAAHIYLTYPYFLSWSMLEAMAAECLVIGSRTPPVEEVIVDGHNGLLVDFHDAHALAERVRAVLERPRDYDAIRLEARRTILERYDLHGHCLPRQKALIASLL
ncbi:glycosyltransferase [Methylobacterium sp. Leaf102]|uniref:glycosyltransferase n=1 Tax=Methylobacterium sp. Leaf102 TaxID=1736253 RepID=UPI0009EC3D63|nr:glycosyltransferase [Methylobacterium sp. Leaf102]